MKLFFWTKQTIAFLCEAFGLNSFSLNRLNRKYKNNYIRIVNYHFSPKKNEKQFEKQIAWLTSRFESCDYKKLNSFLNGEYVFKTKPGIIFTFDDGFLENYEVAYPILKRYNSVGWYMISAGLVGETQYTNCFGQKVDYMGQKEIMELLASNSVIGCHTYTHHRMNITDTPQILKHEIFDAKIKLENITCRSIDLFCWCGGEEWTYTKQASDMIKNSGFKLGMMTNSNPITPNTDKFQLDRTNLEPSWAMSLVKFQISGFIDRKYNKKRKRVHELTK
ncbi:MAG TPA: hypothetical protein DEV87_05810 [Clostridiales bacterium]|nr:hypothetical protein [Clostridiales bacterium]